MKRPIVASLFIGIQEAPLPRKPYKPAETYSPVSEIPDDEVETRNRLREARGSSFRHIRAAETSAVEHRGRSGLSLAANERSAAGGNR
ncbi:hypothetical protein [Terrarubrum flagellatum]|uniref:hypothetical protein n=1 Tax=Terrirubrum flagellatum TaxID=2895980 RepID=UPI0031451CD4